MVNFFQENTACKLFLQPGGNFNNLVLIEGQKFLLGKSRFMDSFSICSKLTRSCIVPLRVSLRVPIAFLVGRLVFHSEHTHVMTCSGRKCRPTNARKIKSANCLYLETVQSLGACQRCLRKVSNY